MLGLAAHPHGLAVRHGFELFSRRGLVAGLDEGLGQIQTPVRVGGIEVHPASLRGELKGLEGQPETGLDVSAHARNFFDCVKSRGRPAANAQVMRHSHIACHAAALSWLLNRKLRLDPAKEEFIGDDEANGLRSLPSRKVL